MPKNFLEINGYFSLACNTIGQSNNTVYWFEKSTQISQLQLDQNLGEKWQF